MTLTTIGLGQSIAGEEGGAGAKGGGEAVVCGDQNPEFLDIHLAKNKLKTRMKLPVAITRSDFRAWLFKRLDAESDFRDLLLAEWDRIGATNTWKVNSDQYELNKFILSDGGLLFNLGQELSATLLARFREQGLVLGSRTYDSYTDIALPRDCHIEQVAFNDANIAMLSSGRIDRKFSELDQRFLELHESLFILGRAKFGHVHPILVREVIATLLDDHSKSSDFRRIISLFKDFKKNSDFFFETNYPNIRYKLYFQGNLVVTTPVLKRIIRKSAYESCPIMLGIEFDGMGGLFIYSYYSKTGHPIVRRSFRIDPHVTHDPNGLEYRYGRDFSGAITRWTLIQGSKSELFDYQRLQFHSPEYLAFSEFPPTFLESNSSVMALNGVRDWVKFKDPFPPFNCQLISPGKKFRPTDASRIQWLFDSLRQVQEN